MKRALTIAFVLASAATVAAQPAPPPPAPDAQPGQKTEEQKKAEAKLLYEDGLKDYNLGEFDEAIKKFKMAYAISSAPGLLFNIAQSYRLKKDYEQATYFYTTYLRLKPDAPNRSDVEARLAEMKVLMEEQKKLQDKPPTGTVTPDGNSSSGKEGNVTVNLIDSRGGGGPTEKDTDAGGSLMTAGLATGGAGAALVVTGVVFGRMARNAEKQLNTLNAMGGAWTQEQQDTYDAGKRNNAIAIISFIAGGAAMATGVTLWGLGYMKKRVTTVAVNPSASGTTFAVGWAF